SQDVNKNLAFIVNQGTIKAANGGYVVLVAPLVDNQGTIVANLGQVGIGAGTGATVNLDPQGLVHVTVLPPSGPASSVTVPSCASSSVLSQIVNTRGIIPAGNVQQNGDGSITLNGVSGLALNEGTISADAIAGHTAGTVTITSSQATVLASGSTLSANGVGDASNGGHVVASSQGDAVFLHGALMSATGGATGNGGTLELSGNHILDGGTVNTTAPGGKMGTFLIDPTNLNIVDGGTGGGNGTLNCALGAGNGTIGAACTGGSCPDTLSVGQIEAQSSSTNISLTASNSITLKNNTNLALNSHLCGCSTVGSSIAMTAGAGGIHTACGATGGITTQGSGSITMSSVGSICLPNYLLKTAPGGGITLSSGSHVGTGTNVINLCTGNFDIVAGSGIAARDNVCPTSVSLSSQAGCIHYQTVIKCAGLCVTTQSVTLSNGTLNANFSDTPAPLSLDSGASIKVCRVCHFNGSVFIDSCGSLTQNAGGSIVASALNLRANCSIGTSTQPLTIKTSTLGASSCRGSINILEESGPKNLSVQNLNAQTGSVGLTSCSGVIIVGPVAGHSCNAPGVSLTVTGSGHQLIVCKCGSVLGTSTAPGQPGARLSNACGSIVVTPPAATSRIFGTSSGGPGVCISGAGVDISGSDGATTICGSSSAAGQPGVSITATAATFPGSCLSALRVGCCPGGSRSIVGSAFSGPGVLLKATNPAATILISRGGCVGTLCGTSSGPGVQVCSAGSVIINGGFAATISGSSVLVHACKSISLGCATRPCSGTAINSGGNVTMTSGQCISVPTPCVAGTPQPPDRIVSQGCVSMTAAGNVSIATNSACPAARTICAAACHTVSVKAGGAITQCGTGTAINSTSVSLTGSSIGSRSCPIRLSGTAKLTGCACGTIAVQGGNGCNVSLHTRNGCLSVCSGLTSVRYCSADQVLNACGSGSSANIQVQCQDIKASSVGNPFNTFKCLTLAAKGITCAGPGTFIIARSLTLHAGACGIFGSCSPGLHTTSNCLTATSAGSITLCNTGIQPVPTRPRFRGVFPTLSNVSLTSCGNITFTQVGCQSSAQFGTVSAKGCATLKVSCGSLTIKTGAKATAGGKISLLDPTGLMLVNGCVSGATVCLNAAQVQIPGTVSGTTTTITGTSQVQLTGQVKGCTTNISGPVVQLGGQLTGGTLTVNSTGPLCQGSSISGKCVSLSSGSSINQVGCGLVKGCTVKLLSSTPCNTVGTATKPLQVCSPNVTIDPASAFVNDLFDPTTLALTTAKGCLSFTAPKCFNVNFKSACSTLTANATTPTNLAVNVTCSNIHLGCVKMPGSTVSITAGSKTGAFSILCGNSKLITSGTLTLASSACIGKGCAPITVCTRTLKTCAPGSVHVINTFKCPNTTTCNTAQCANLSTNQSVVSVTSCTSTSTGSASNGPTTTGTCATSSSPINTSGCVVATNTETTTSTTGTAGGCSAGLGGSTTNSIDQSVSQGFNNPDAPGGLLNTPTSPNFPGLVPLNDPLEQHFQAQYPDAPLQEPSRSLLPDPKKKDKRSLFRRLFTITRRRH
ncbi:MAG: hypothetical protein ACYCW6_15700, partial [Candidatus Xenobia bacterium]